MSYVDKDSLMGDATKLTFLAGVKRSFFPSMTQGIISLIILLALLYLGVIGANWAIFNAVWAPNAAEACAQADGACWSVITTRWRLIFFGLYPAEEQWRAAIATLVLLGAVILSCLPMMMRPIRIITLWIAAFAIFLLLMQGAGIFTAVSSERWSGLPLTMFIYAAVIVLGWPLAVCLALLRVCDYPVIRLVVAGAVDIIRSLPLLTILFAFSLIIPLFLPPDANVDKVYRVIFGFTIFFACYQSEIVRGGLQSVPPGQTEAAKALGLGYAKTMCYVVLPQVIRNVMPMSVNQLVISFKETSIIIIVGLFELLAAAKSAFGTADWNAYYKEVYIFIAIIYFLFSFGLSSYGKYLEEKMSSPTSK